MKSLLVTLWLRSLQDIARMGSYPGTTRDCLTMQSRVEAEGLSFLTITLPSYCKDFERSLAVGRIDTSFFRSFKKKGRIPAFLQGIVCRVFDHDGILRVSPDIEAIKHVRQLTLMFKKLEADCTPKRVQAALNAYASVERDLASLHVDKTELYRFTQLARYLWREFEVVDFDTLRPKYGPGVTAERLSQSARRKTPFWPLRLDKSFPVVGTAISLSTPTDGIIQVSEEHETPVRVICVPKTLKGPRVIAAEPASMQFCQQSLLDHVESKLRKFYPEFLDLRDQSRNRRLSYNLACATLDLSEASDRVHGALVYLMLDSCPNLRDMSFACRSTRAELPDGTIIPLQKFASMGSALCFPYESMVFFTIIILKILGNRPIHHARAILSELRGTCSVYGDDIIVPIHYASLVIDGLEGFGLRVNRDKSFWTGKFRETCGSDTYDGVDVTPLYCRRFMTKDDPNSVVSHANLANMFYSRGMVDTAEFIRNFYKKILPYRAPDERFVGFTFAGKVKARFNKSLHRREVVTHVAVARTSPYKLEGWDGLNDWFIRALRSKDTHIGKDRRKSTPLKIKRVWTAV